MTEQTNPTQQEAILMICLMAAFADGGKSDLEREELRRVAESLASDGINMAALYRRVLLKQVSVAGMVGPLASQPLRQLAYEMAVCVCEADDVLNEAERAFLGELRRHLDLNDKTAASFQARADSVALAPLADATVSTASPSAEPPAAQPSDADVDKMVINYAILNGALELLPESLATMAIIPLQMKMVYRVGKRYGYELDRRHITELLGAAGIGLTSQVIEGYARKLIGGLIGKVAGKLGRGAANQLTSSVMSFASTYALGMLARRYYAGGRSLSAVELRQVFMSLADQARSLHGRYRGEIAERARQLDPAQLLDLVRGSHSEPSRLGL